MSDYTMGEKLAYRGKQGCEDVRCTEAPFARAEGMCFGWHCARCDEPTSMMGHACTSDDRKGDSA